MGIVSQDISQTTRLVTWWAEVGVGGEHHGLREKGLLMTPPHLLVQGHSWCVGLCSRQYAFSDLRLWSIWHCLSK